MSGNHDLLKADTIDPEVARDLDRLCDSFEDALRQGGQPRIEDYLAQAPEAAREFLLHELTILELEHGEHEPSLEAYLQRFPGKVGLIQQAFASARIKPRGGSTVRRGRPQLPSIPGYELMSEIGRGGMGVVYKARQKSLDRVVAVKVVRSGEADPVRLRREAEAIARVEHPHIVRIHDCGEATGIVYFSMEYLAGGTLAQRIADRPLPQRQAAELVETLARAVQHIHDRGLVHRDLKPSNILLEKIEGEENAGADGVDGYRAKIADFGLTKVLGPHVAETAQGTILGTASFMAPEQASGESREAGPAVDVYGLGAILYTALTGRPPFEAASWRETLAEVCMRPPLPPSRFVADLSPRLEAICLKCLEKEPARRYPTAAALAADLHTAFETRSEPASIHEKRRFPQLASLPPRAWVAIAVLLFAPLLGAALMIQPKTGSTAGTDQAPAPANVHITELRIAHFRGEPAASLGDMGRPSRFARLDDDVRVHARTDRRAYCYLLALNPNGTEQLCWPAKDNEPPSAAMEWHYPPGNSDYFGLTDGAGLQVFVLLASEQPLPPYKVWRQKAGESGWRAQTTDGVWEFDRVGLRQIVVERGQVRTRQHQGLVDLVQFLQRCPGIDDVKGIAFPVESKKEK